MIITESFYLSLLLTSFDMIAFSYKLISGRSGSFDQIDFKENTFSTCFIPKRKLYAPVGFVQFLVCLCSQYAFHVF